ncbi:hypothetical protein ACFLWS_04735 [Chloroflexota bacterium]
MALFSQFESLNIRDKHENEDWRALQSSCKAFSDWGAGKLRQLMGGTVKCVVNEPHYVCKDHRNLYTNFYSKKHGEVSKYTSRFHFFNIPDVSVSDLIQNPETYKDKYIGYSVIRPVPERCLGRTVIDPLRLVKFQSKTLYCLRTGFNTHIGGQHFVAYGYPYISQDVDVTRCAHTALWGVCRYLSEKYSVYGELYPFDLIELTGSNNGRTFPNRGMTYEDYSNILTKFGAYPWIMRIQKPDQSNPSLWAFNDDEYLDLCTYVESGFPVLASLSGHVVTLVGHTIDYSQSPQADSSGFIYSSSFYKQFIVVDDNFAPYQLLGGETDLENYGKNYANSGIGGPQGISMKSIVTAVCPLPEKVFLTANKVRTVARSLFNAYKARIGSGSEPIVLRLFLTTSTSFQERKGEQTIDNGKVDMLNYSVTQMKLPHFIWVTEASPLSLYLQGRCTSEIVIDPTSNPNEDIVIYMRLRDAVIIDGTEYQVDDASTEIPQYIHNLGIGAA